ncbi:Uncharacterised protein [Vibrio cholerae]|nr:Uncharacterised protein [Vibrio cholerae]
MKPWAVWSKKSSHATPPFLLLARKSLPPSKMGKRR